jgi:hypothetical protein
VLLSALTRDIQRNRGSHQKYRTILTAFKLRRGEKNNLFELQEEYVSRPRQGFDTWRPPDFVLEALHRQIIERFEYDLTDLVAPGMFIWQNPTERPPQLFAVRESRVDPFCELLHLHARKNIRTMEQLRALKCLCVREEVAHHRCDSCLTGAGMISKESYHSLLCIGSFSRDIRKLLGNAVKRFGGA